MPSRFTNRREWLRAGGLGCLGWSLSSLLRAEDAAPQVATRGFGRAKSCLVLFLSGGHPQHETFDPKPEAAAEIRGEFGPIATSVPGLHFCELLPRVAKEAHRFTLIRSMVSGSNGHSTSGYAMFTGRPHAKAGQESPASPDDWPALAGVLARLRPSERAPLSAITLPERIVNNPGVPWPGQTGGFMGPDWDPFVFNCDPSQPDFRVDALSFPDDVPLSRFESRRELLAQFDARQQRSERVAELAAVDRFRARAYELLHSGAARAAFDLTRESEALRDKYGRHKFGQSVLLGRRLIEAGVRLVQVNFPREPGDLSLGNPLWDTHSNNAKRLKMALCPPFDQAFAALLNDMGDRGLLSETLVLVLSEFGRSPKINGSGGRDHWGDCFSIVCAGCGIPGGQVVGGSDKQGGYPTSRPIHPGDLAATMAHFLGVSPRAEFLDRLQRPLRITEGEPIAELVGGDEDDKVTG